MTSHDWFIEQRTAYATRTLDQDEERTFRDHLIRCEDCRREVALIERDFGWLPMAVEPAVPPPGFRWRAAASILGHGRRSRWFTWGPVAAAAAVVLVTGALARQYAAEAERLSTQLAQSETSLVALGDTVAVLRRAAKIMQASIEMDDHRGNLMIFVDDVTHRWNVVLHGMPPAPAGEKYQFWFISADGMVRSAELSPTGDGSLILTLAMPDRGGQVLGAALSMEPITNASDIPKGKELAHLML